MAESIQPQEKDYRGVFALEFTTAFFAILGGVFYLGGISAFVSVAAVLGPMEGMILERYFGQKS